MTILGEMSVLFVETFGYKIQIPRFEKNIESFFSWYKQIVVQLIQSLCAQIVMPRHVTKKKKIITVRLLHR